jgi:hypothetical protein
MRRFFSCSSDDAKPESFSHHASRIESTKLVEIIEQSINTYQGNSRWKVEQGGESLILLTGNVAITLPCLHAMGTKDQDQHVRSVSKEGYFRQKLNDGHVFKHNIMNREDLIAALIEINTLIVGQHYNECREKLNDYASTLTQMDDMDTVPISIATRAIFSLKHGIFASSNEKLLSISLSDQLKLIQHFVGRVKLMHEEGQVFNDLHPGNVLIDYRDDQFQLDFIDFGRVCESGVTYNREDECGFLDQPLGRNSPKTKRVKTAKCSYDNIGTLRTVFALLGIPDLDDFSRVESSFNAWYLPIKAFDFSLTASLVKNKDKTLRLINKLLASNSAIESIKIKSTGYRVQISLADDFCDSKKFIPELLAQANKIFENIARAKKAHHSRASHSASGYMPLPRTSLQRNSREERKDVLARSLASCLTCREDHSRLHGKDAYRMVRIAC